MTRSIELPSRLGICVAWRGYGDSDCRSDDMEGLLLKNPLILLVDGILFKARRERAGLEGALLGEVMVGGGEGERVRSTPTGGEVSSESPEKLDEGASKESAGTDVCPSNSDSKSAT